MNYLESVRRVYFNNRKTKPKRKPNPRIKSYVWYYFDRLATISKCRICRHEIKHQKNKGTSGLIRHLEKIHALEDRGVLVSDMSSIPTLLQWPRTIRACMRERVYECFQEDSNGNWRCKICTYTCRVRNWLQMFQHLRTVHWKANEMGSENLDLGKFCRVVINSFDTTTEDMQYSEDTSSYLENPLNRLEEDKSRAVNDMDAQFDGGSNSDRVLTGEESTVDRNGLGEYKIKIILPDGNEVEGLVVGGEEGSENSEQGKPAVDPNAKSQIISPISPEKRFGSNSQKAIEDAEDGSQNDVRASLESAADDRKKFEKTFSEKTSRKSVPTILRHSKTPNKFKPIRPNGKNYAAKIETIKPDPADLEIQVPLSDAPRLSTGVKRRKNNQTSIHYEYINTERAGENRNVAVITLNRPKALNALCKKLVSELNEAVTRCDHDDSIGAIIITGNETAFAAGTDVKEMQNLTYTDMNKNDSFVIGNFISKASKPVIAAVNGYALGGGCELAMMCDIIYAGDKARFGQPEIIIGTIPGSGGIQRLTRAIGKSKAMEMVLTGNQISAAEAEKSGLVSKIFPPEQLLSEAIKLGEKISSHTQPILSMAKEAVNSAYETTLQQGLHLEKKLFCGTFATADQKEGMMAFLEKRAPKFKNE